MKPPMAKIVRPPHSASCCVLVLVLSTLWPLSANRSVEVRNVRPQPLPKPPQRLESTALQHWSRRLQRHQYDLDKQAILVESLDGSKVLAELNPEKPLNPASVMKLATSLVALARFGPDHRFVTRVYADNLLDREKRSLQGNLYLRSDGNPLLRKRDVYRLARSLVRRGLRRLNGDLVVVGPFSVKSTDDPSYSLRYLARAFRRTGIRIQGTTRAVPDSGFDQLPTVHFLSHTSESMREILWKQNTFSINDIADRLGRVLGGAEAIRHCLIEEFGINGAGIHVENPSGLGHNRMTARAAIQVLRRLRSRLRQHHMDLQDILPVAGVDRGTLNGRFRRSKYRGGVLGKTGTNSSKEKGISSLAGLAMTRTHGPVLYAILNTEGSVLAYRRWQDQFLRKLIDESGGMSRKLNASPKSSQVYTSSPWIPSRHWHTLTLDTVYPRNTSKGTNNQARMSAAQDFPGHLHLSR